MNRLLINVTVLSRVSKKRVFKDFGPVAIRWFKNSNKNKKLDNGESLSGQMFHTTPQNEAEHASGAEIKLAPSHGCIHLKPADRDTIFANGGAFFLLLGPAANKEEFSEINAMQALRFLDIIDTI